LINKGNPKNGSIHHTGLGDWCFFIFEMILPSTRGCIARTDSTMPNEAAHIAIGIIGATVMPHNLYLHSSLVNRKFDDRRN
jgi:Mn2+/Fe2+ NRAMP family transporter